MHDQFQRNTLAFSVQTAPDVATGHLLYGLDGLDDADTARAMQHIRMQQHGTQDLPVHQHKVTAIAVAGLVQGRFTLVSLGQGADEAAILADFYRRVTHPDTLMLSYGGTQHLPILRCRALMHGVVGGRDDQLDLATWLAGTADDYPPLDEIMSVQGLPQQSPDLSPTAQAQTRAVQVYLQYLRYACWQGQLTEAEIPQHEQDIRAALEASKASHWQSFLNNWPAV